MPRTYTIADARAKLAEIVDEVESGKDVEITRRGKKVAVVVSAARWARVRGEPAAFGAAYDRFLAEHDLDEIGVEPSWPGELRDRSSGRDVEL